MLQQTIQNPVEITGVGLHSGEAVTLILQPAPTNTGIVFRRTDMAGSPEIPALAQNVCDTRMCTTLKQGAASVATVEHVLSALQALQIDNLYLDVSAPELPVLDGSSFVFVEALQKVGVKQQSGAKQYIKVLKTVRVEDGDKWAELVPYDGFKVVFDIEYNHPAIVSTALHYEFELSDLEQYKSDISKARTYGFLKEYEWLKANNLARGGSLENALVLDEEKIMNPDGLRVPDEFVKHKILDAIGDMYLVGKSLKACYRGYKSGHGLNNQLALALMRDPSAFEIVEVL